VSTHGVGTPAAPTEASKEGAEEENNNNNGGLKAVTEEQAEWVQKLQDAGFEWTPWPNNAKIWGGNLMQIQRSLLDFKKDPWKEKAEVPVDEEMEEEAGKEQVEEPKKEAVAPAPAVRRESVIARPLPVEEKPRQQFDLFDFDEEED
jgi:muramoyltetrapeptide carboxypeptidase LdcA involved in peptidoglycan recycling